MGYFAYSEGIAIAPYIWMLNAALVSCLAILAFLTLQDSDEDTWPVRSHQRWRLGRMRLARLLKLRHVDVAAYLDAIRIVAIKAQIVQCRNCPNKAICDRTLQTRAASESRYSFCPNAPFIDGFLKSAGNGA